MKVWHRLIVALLLVGCCVLGNGTLAIAASADSLETTDMGRFIARLAVPALVVEDPGAIAPTPSAKPSLPHPMDELFEKLQRFQDDRQLQELVEKDLERSITIRSQIQEEVDRAFNHTTALLNVLLVVLTCLPVLAAISIWFIRRSVLNQIIAETKRQLQEEVGKQLEADVADEVKQQAEAFQKKLEALETEFHEQLAQLQTLFSDAQKQKDQIIQELAQLTPSLSRESANPDVQAKIQVLTEQLERLKSGNAALSFTANDYVEQGRAFYFENRFEDAIAAYDKALQMEPDNPKAWFSRGAALVKLQQWDGALQAYDRALQLKPDIAEAWFGRAAVLVKQQDLVGAIAAYDQALQLKSDFFLAWFGKARCHALQQQADPALDALQHAFPLNRDRAKEAVKTDTAFDALRDHPWFQQLIAS